MEKSEVFEKISDNLKDIDKVENDISMLQLAIYQKSIDKLKFDKLDEISDFFEQQSSYYYQHSENFQQEIDKNTQKYKEQIEKLINVYDKLYVRTFKIMQNAINNQKIAIANIVTLNKKLEKEDVSVEDAEKYKNMINAFAKKKVNYSVIVKECKARIKWCVENVQKDITEVFTCKVSQLEPYKEKTINKIKEMILNRIFGKARFKRLLEEYETEQIKIIKNKNNSKVLGVIIVIDGIEKQFEEIKAQISSQYNETLQN